MKAYSVFVHNEIPDLIVAKETEHKPSVLKEIKLTKENAVSTLMAYGKAIKAAETHRANLELEMTTTVMKKCLQDPDIRAEVAKHTVYDVQLSAEGLSKKKLTLKEAERAILDYEQSLEKKTDLSIKIVIVSPLGGYEISWTEPLVPGRSIFSDRAEEKDILNIAWTRNQKRTGVMDFVCGWLHIGKTDAREELNREVLQFLKHKGEDVAARISGRTRKT